ncbi:MAG: hypothetical protein ACQEXJ_21005 [Myxococcota bacterium]
MTATATATQTWTHTATRAQVNHFGMKVGAEIRNLFVRPGLMSEDLALNLRDDICAYLSRGFAEVVSLQLRRGPTVVFALEFTLEQWNGTASDDRGRGYRRPDTAGLNWGVFIEQTARFDELDEGEKRKFWDSLEGSWGPADRLEYDGGGAWSGVDRHHVHTGSQLSRRVFG